MSPAGPAEGRPYIWPATEDGPYEVWAPFPSRLLASCTSLASALAARRLLQGPDAQGAEGEGVGSA